MTKSLLLYFVLLFAATASFAQVQDYIPGISNGAATWGANVGTHPPGNLGLDIIAPADFLEIDENITTHQSATIRLEGLTGDWKPANPFAQLSIEPLGGAAHSWLSDSGDLVLSLSALGYPSPAMPHNILLTNKTGGNILFGVGNHGSDSASERMVITNTGKVGIGTGAPNATLDIFGSLGFNGNAGTSGAVLMSQGSSTAPVWESTTALDSAIDWEMGGNNLVLPAKIGTINLYDLPIITSDTERMRITRYGNVGIGTSTPAEALDVEGPAGGNVQFGGALMPGGYAGLDTSVNDGKAQVLVSHGPNSPPQWENITGGIIYCQSCATNWNTCWWALGGNELGGTPALDAIHNQGIQQLGTTSNSDVPIITNNVEVMRVTTYGTVGIGTQTPALQLTIGGGTPNDAGPDYNDGSIYANGVSSGAVYHGTTLDGAGIAGTGVRLLWYPYRAAFRAGAIDEQVILDASAGAEWDDAHIGNYSFAGGLDNQASGDSSTCFGASNVASNAAATAFGNSNVAAGKSSLATGQSTAANGDYSNASGFHTIAGEIYSSASGRYALASGYASVANGNNVTASTFYSLAMVDSSTASGYASVAIGDNVTATNNYSLAMVDSSIASGYASAAIGDKVTASGINSLAMVEHSIASGYTSIAMGDSSIAAGDFSIAIGASNTVSTGNSIAIGEFNTAFNTSTADSTVDGHAWGSPSIAMGIGNLAGCTDDGDIAIGGWNASIGAGKSVLIGYTNRAETSAGASYIFGNVNHATAVGTMILGFDAEALQTFAFVIGKGAGSDLSGSDPSGNLPRLTNNHANSLAIGFSSDIPTLFVGNSNGAGTTGNVGIGTGGQLPIQKLEVDSGNILLSNYSSGGLAGQLQFQSPDGHSGLTTFQAGDQGSTTIEYTLPNAAPTVDQVLSVALVSGTSPALVNLTWADGGTGASIAWLIGGNTNITSSSYYLGTQSTSTFKPLVIETNGSEAMRIDANQLVGIGNFSSTSISAPLDVEKSGTNGIGVLLKQTLSNEQEVSSWCSTCYVLDALRIQASFSPTDASVTENNAIHAINGDVVLEETDASVTHQIRFANTGSYGGHTYSDWDICQIGPGESSNNPASLLFEHASISPGDGETNCMDLGPNGDVGIGTTSQTQKLEVLDGNIFINNDSRTAGELIFQDQGDIFNGAPNNNHSSFRAGQQSADNSGNSYNYKLPDSSASFQTNNILTIAGFTRTGTSGGSTIYDVDLQWMPCCSTGGIIGPGNGGDSSLLATIKQQQQTINDLSNRLSQMEQKINQITGSAVVPDNQNVAQSQITASLQIVPNPFSNSTTISYSLSAPIAGAQIIVGRVASGITEALFNISGVTSGSIVLNGGSLAPGTYRCSIVAGNAVLTSQNIVLVK